MGFEFTNANSVIKTFLSSYQRAETCLTDYFSTQATQQVLDLEFYILAGNPV